MPTNRSAARIVDVALEEISRGKASRGKTWEKTTSHPLTSTENNRIDTTLESGACIRLTLKPKACVGGQIRRFRPSNEFARLTQRGLADDWIFALVCTHRAAGGVRIVLFLRELCLHHVQTASHGQGSCPHGRIGKQGAKVVYMWLSERHVARFSLFFPFHAFPLLD